MVNTSPTLAVLLDEWLDERQSDRGLSANTESAYRSDLRVLAERIAGPRRDTSAAAGDGRPADHGGDPRRPCRPGPSRSRASQPQPGPLDRRSLCRWLVRRGLLEADPTVEIERPAQPRRLPVALTDAQLGQVLAAAST